jgi:hypothetical protein
MWSRKELKDRAKEVLSKIYLGAFGISLVLALVGATHRWSSNGSHNNSFRNNLYYNHYDRYGFINFPFTHWPFIQWTHISFFFIAFVVVLALRIFVGYALEVGGRRYFVQAAQYKDRRNCFSFGFDQQNHMSIVTTMLFKNILIFLWTLLLIIPGIIKSYAYSMVPYILADNPNIGATRAIELSNEMTRGHKFDMFILDLSFLGWYILGALAFGIGTFFVMPYENATDAELYLVLRREALYQNMCSYDELLLD